MAEVAAAVAAATHQKIPAAVADVVLEVAFGPLAHC